ncbi:MAG: Hpt domain-containing protein [Hungatella sp.]
MKKLKEYGADVEGAMGRFLGDVELYKTCFSALLADESFPQLGEALLEQNYAKAFENAHTLKGIIGNMGITPLYLVICNMVETMRNQEQLGLQEDYAEVQAHLTRLREMQS